MRGAQVIWSPFLRLVGVFSETEVCAVRLALEKSIDPGGPDLNNGQSSVCKEAQLRRPSLTFLLIVDLCCQWSVCSGCELKRVPADTADVVDNIFLV